MAGGFFVTGTDTGVGKTVIAGAIIAGLRANGVPAGAMKPVETGCTRTGSVLTPSDGMFLKKVGCMDDPINRVTPFCFETPVAPVVAAGLEGGAVDPAIIRKDFAGLLAKYRTMVVEGVGGLLVPLTPDYYTADLARDLGLPLIVVARPTLGTINHTLLTVRYALREGLSVAGVVLNYTAPEESGVAEQTNPGVIRRLCPVPLLGIFPFLNAPRNEDLTKAALRHLDMRVLLDGLS